MAEHLSSEEIQRRYVAAMGPQLGEVHFRLWNECAWLHLKWHEYVALFGTNPSRIELLNRAGHGFVRLLQGSLWQDVLLHISRLTDPPRSAGRENLTLERLRLLVDDRIRQSVVCRLDSLKVTCKFARDWRNRHIGHIDLALATHAGAHPLEPASRESVRKALAEIAALLNSVECAYDTGAVAYEIVSHLGGAEMLLHVIRDGLESREKELEQLRAGVMSDGPMRKPAV